MATTARCGSGKRARPRISSRCMYQHEWAWPVWSTVLPAQSASRTIREPPGRRHQHHKNELVARSEPHGHTVDGSLLGRNGGQFTSDPSLIYGQKRPILWTTAAGVARGGARSRSARLCGAGRGCAVGERLASVSSVASPRRPAFDRCAENQLVASVAVCELPRLLRVFRACRIVGVEKRKIKGGRAGSLRAHGPLVSVPTYVADSLKQSDPKKLGRL